MTAEEFVGGVIFGVQAYLVVGFAFSLPLAFFFLHRVDPTAREGSWAFRVVILPGLSILWPLFVWRLARGQTTPTESNAHRARAASNTTSDKRAES